MALSLDSFVSIPIPQEVYSELTRRYPDGVASIVEHAITSFLDRTAEDFEVEAPKKRGVQWDSLFLPDGTEVRTRYFGKVHLARIVDGEIIWGDQLHVSMSQLASGMRGNTSNNAWKVLEIKRPADAGWQLADRLRR
jgi:hypothetical protein